MPENESIDERRAREMREAESLFADSQVPDANNPLLVERVAQSAWEIYVGYLEKGFTPAQAVFLAAVWQNSNPIAPLGE